MFRWRRFIFIFLIIFIGSESCSNDLSKLRDSIDEENPPNIISTDVQLIRSDSGNVQVLVEAPLRKDYTNNQESYSVLPEGITAYFFDKKHDTSSVLTANHAILYHREEVYIIKDSVKVVNQFGDRLRTQSLTWNNKMKTIYTLDYVEIERNGRILYGDGLRANEDFTNYQILTPKGSIAIQ